MEDTRDETSEQSFSPCSSEIGDAFGIPEVIPRVGDEFQAEIPSLTAEFYRLQLVKMPRNSESAVNDLKSSSFGLPIPVMWSDTGAENINGSVGIENSVESLITSSNQYPGLKVEPMDPLSGCVKYLGVETNIQEATRSDKMEAELVMLQQPSTKLDQIGRGLCPLPDSLPALWTEVECNSFVLGLHIYGKNLVSVKKFVESKEMGDILSFYYGEFYKSKQYCRWSESRKLRNRRSICEQRIFTGWKQQELLSRLFSHVSHECQSTLLEVCRKFAERKISLEEYISTLKSTVGINMLIEAVGIGKGNHDLTGISMEPVKANNPFAVRTEIPFGKAFSSLALSDIIRCLTGGVRLSKARSSDLFWEAVWPRLLARGWHSEQPKDIVISGVKNSLVYIIPGVKKFSRRKLVKGNHYFDSISDVLNKVASDPWLLEIEIDAANGSHHEEDCGLDTTRKQDQDGLSKKRSNSYPQPQPSNPSPKRAVYNFTIVDTSLANGAEQRKVRELRNLSIETTCASVSSSFSSESDEDTSDDSHEDKIETITLNVVDNVTHKRNFEDSSDHVNSNLNNGAHSNPDPTTVAKENPNQINDKEARRTMKFHFSRKLKRDQSKYLLPFQTQEGNVSCDGGESRCSSKHTSVHRTLNRDYSNYSSHSGDVCEGMACQAPPQYLSPACSSEKVSPTESNEEDVDTNGPGGGASAERVQLTNLIDLNKPPISPHFVDNEQVMTEREQNNDNMCVNDSSSSFLSETGTHQPESYKLPDAGADPEQQATVNSRRQSTRNRPLTTKALEALEMGFFSTKKRKGEDLWRTNPKSRSSYRKAGIKNPGDDAVAADTKTGESMQVFHDQCLKDSACPVEETLL